jgi:hypothetical protein
VALPIMLSAGKNEPQEPFLPMHLRIADRFSRFGQLDHLAEASPEATPTPPSPLRVHWLCRIKNWTAFVMGRVTAFEVPMIAGVFVTAVQFGWELRFVVVWRA